MNATGDQLRNPASVLKLGAAMVGRCGKSPRQLSREVAQLDVFCVHISPSGTNERKKGSVKMLLGPSLQRFRMVTIGQGTCSRDAMTGI